jgi:hypothetical protein
MQLLENKNLEKLMLKTGLNSQQIETKIESEIMMIEDSSAVSLDDLVGSDYYGMSVAEFVDSIQDVTKICERLLAHKPGVSCAYIFINVMGLIMMGDGECPKCGSDETEIVDQSGAYAGDGYFSEREYIGVTSKVCNHCSCEFSIE